MHKLLISIYLLAFCFLSNALAQGLESEIRSGNYCQTDIYNRFKLLEKTEHQRLKFGSNEELLQFAVRIELMCPWSIQRDLNGDKKQDWVGYVKNGSKYQLIAYLSGARKYTLFELSHSDKPPEKNFLRWIQTKYLNRYTKKKLKIGNTKYAVQVATIGGTADIYLWDGKQLENVLTTSQIF